RDRRCPSIHVERADAPRGQADPQVVIERDRAAILNVHFSSVVIPNGRPGITVIIARGVVPGRQTAAVGDNEPAPRSAVTDGYLASANRAVHDARRSAGVEIRLIPM